MLTAFRWNVAGCCGASVPDDQIASLGRQIKESKDVFCIALETASPDEELLAFETILHVHPLTLEDITKPRREPTALPHFPKVEEFPDYLFVVVNPLDRLPSDGGAAEASTHFRPQVR